VRGDEQVFLFSFAGEHRQGCERAGAEEEMRRMELESRSRCPTESRPLVRKFKTPTAEAVDIFLFSVAFFFTFYSSFPQFHLH
jgi:hypothetical protein